MNGYQRYAIYYAPPPGPLADFAACWLGWDPVAGCARPHPDLPGLPAPVAELTAAPRKYGFHGTLKAPFRLAADATGEALAAACADLAHRLGSVEMAGLRLARIGGFLALIPDEQGPALQALAAEVVTALDRFRAPLTPADLARRGADRLAPHHRALLERWGYPYVMGEFRFHLTLTGDLAPDAAETVRAALEPRLAPMLPRPFPVDALCLFGEAADGRFRLLHRYTLSG